MNQPLPDVNQIPNRAIAVFWDDLFVEKKSVRVFPDQDMSWTFTNLAPNRVVSFEWKARVFGPASDSWAHFTLNFNADINQARIQYVHLAKTKGEGATVGMQDTYSKWLLGLLLSACSSNPLTLVASV